MENTTVRERLILFINELGISKNKFEYNVGMGKRYVSNIVNSIQPSMIEKISLVYPQLNIGWLLTGEGEMLKSANISIGIETEMGIAYNSRREKDFYCECFISRYSCRSSNEFHRAF